ncbi:hypothetical protein Leryth_026407 [Lithospermum erythrorhizon]|nr:hypothetical protein Leryth_026407 [Lithospermum erythrorhizon]
MSLLISPLLHQWLFQFLDAEQRVLYLRMAPILIWHFGFSMDRMELFLLQEDLSMVLRSQHPNQHHHSSTLWRQRQPLLASRFGIDAFSEMLKNRKGKSKSSNRGSSSKGGNSKHEWLGNEWLQSGNCPIANSYRAVSKVLPLVAKAIQPPPGINLKCPPAIVAARAALARTAFAKNLRPQPLPAKVLVIGALGMATNIPLGIWREHTEMFSPSWFAAVHAAVPFIAMLRKTILMPKSAMALTIAASILGQVIGSRAERYRLKAVSLQKLETIESSISGCCKEADGVQGGPAGEIVSWNKVGWQIGGVSSLV